VALLVSFKKGSSVLLAFKGQKEREACAAALLRANPLLHVRAFLRPTRC